MIHICSRRAASPRCRRWHAPRRHLRDRAAVRLV